ncbi:peptidylprolyl isomerase [Pseudomaricurvus alkylphenolicus]|uniref:FKBP-type peptidyl-prolyl cis-trans isomerase n=1 Tax=Pseudomaricurvus alkylphenolicus TaxID=1306991 RepID=UPI00142406F3|nr:peptidylprolyl isomerase [Pseudomaricurvus alkylphenolicus]NIB41976.1 peptidylprolyl isomerase [Pseudomaricurvus alkylphenolicus]
MTITTNKVATIHYTLKNEQGETLDSSEGQEPLAYLQGHQNLVPGLEQALEGKSVGDKLSLVVAPEQGYGDKDPELIQELPRSMFGGIDNIEVGMEFHAETAQGMQIVEVIDVEEDTITIDGNHPLAGVDLHFEVEVMEIRDATEEELQHGHVHGAEGCGHDH